MKKGKGLLCLLLIDSGKIYMTIPAVSFFLPPMLVLPGFYLSNGGAANPGFYVFFWMTSRVQGTHRLNLLFVLGS